LRLDPQKREIRLISVLPGDWTDEVKCELSRLSLESRPRYEALSYVWGDPNDTRPIIVDGWEVQVTANLEPALRRLRYPDIPRVLWVDAVCTYQDRYRSKCCRNLRFEPRFCEGVGFAHLACRIGKFTLRVFIMEIYQYIAFYLHLTIPPSRRLARSSSQYDHVSLL
jgi:Heterokaryon incompatibility protein (HET)